MTPASARSWPTAGSRRRDTVVPQFRDGECAVRRLWDEAAAAALGWDARELANLRRLLHQEPHVRGLGYNQYADEIADLSEPAPPPSLNKRFQRLVAEWNDADGRPVLAARHCRTRRPTSKSLTWVRRRCR